MTYKNADSAFEKALAGELQNYNPSTIGGAAQSTAPTRTSELVADAFSDTTKLVYRITELADRLCGSVPTDAHRSAQEDAGGLLPNINARANEVFRAINRANEALDRIESQL